MQLTKSELQKIIKEEINNMLNERELPGYLDAPRAPAGQQKQQQKLPQDALLQVGELAKDVAKMEKQFLDFRRGPLDKAITAIFNRLNALDGKGQKY